MGLLRSVAALHASGHPVDWRRRYPAGLRHVVLPNTPWRRERVWVEHPDGAGRAGRRRKVSAAGEGPFGAHPLLERHVPLAGIPDRHVWEVDLDTVAFPYLAHHRVHGAVVVVGMTFVEMAVAAGARLFGQVPELLTAIDFEHALVLPEGATRTVQIIVSQGEDDRLDFEVHSRAEPSPDDFPRWLRHASGTIHHPRSPSGPIGARSELGPIRDRCAEMLRGDDCYKFLADIGAEFLPLLQGIQRSWLGDGHLETLAEIEEPHALVEEISRHHVHPAVLDACGQALLVPFSIAAASAEVGTCVPRRIDRLWIGERPGRTFWSHARRNGEMKADSFSGDVRLLDDTGAVLVEVQGFHLQAPEHHEVDLGESLFQVEWQPAPHADAGPAAIETSGRWLILADRSGAAATLRSLIEARGEDCIMATRSDHYERLAPDHYLIDPGCPDDFERLLSDVLSAGGPACPGVVHLFSLDGSDEADVARLEEAQESGPIAVLHLVQALGKFAGTRAPRIWVFTAGAAAGEDASTPASMVDAPLWGLGRTIANEHPEFRFTTVDIPRTHDVAVLEEAFAELWSPDDENQIALLPAGRLAARLVRRSLDELGADRGGSSCLQGGRHLPHHRRVRWPRTGSRRLDGGSRRPEPRARRPARGVLGCRTCGRGRTAGPWRQRRGEHGGCRSGGRAGGARGDDARRAAGAAWDHPRSRCPR